MRRKIGWSAKSFLSNWRDYEAPLPKKVRLSLRNRWIATGLMKGCCGHPGEPGC